MTASPGTLQALARLYEAVAALRPWLETAEQKSALAQIEEAAARIAGPLAPAGSGMKEFDPSRLRHLLDITGPDLASELLARLSEDLTATEAKLNRAAGDLDWKALREGSHVLISLSGSVGALSLQAMAERLNAIAHARDRAALEPLMPPLAGELTALIGLIRSTTPPEARPA
ncbi:Hpt domain-containing protein [Rhodobacter calidifons]|uniref:HPt domain-containing protein n=1 Tax=Rhodobacter calidifons TaxID=2715277 RepID=A0ABX0G4D8_9RHOB|nr:Hpt domain-containing protein [Rhodobacter calidifons]NHB76090.1 hypothetical protein [Rhodobacter calidifons]